MNIPAGVSVPNAELVYRVHDFALIDTTIVINCAERTRSIIGAQTLINARLPNRVVALRGGTMMAFGGIQLENGTERSYSTLSEEARARALTYAADVADHWGVKTIDRATFDAWRND